MGCGLTAECDNQTLRAYDKNSKENCKWIPVHCLTVSSKLHEGRDLCSVKIVFPGLKTIPGTV